MATWTYPDIDPIAFAIGAVEIRWYGLAYLAGFAVATWILWRLNLRWRVGLNLTQALDVLLAAIASVLVGGRLGYVLVYNPSFYLENPEKILAIWDGGMSFHGALVGIVLAGAFMARRLHVPFLRLADMGAVGAPFGIFLGRLANFVNGELWGRVTDVPWAMVFAGAGPDPRHPSQLYEAFGEGLLILVVLLLLSRRKRPDGTYTGLFLLLYGIARLAVEFAREPDVQLGFVLGPFTMGQLLTVPMLALGGWLVWRAWRSGADETSAGEQNVGD